MPWINSYIFLKSRFESITKNAVFVRLVFFVLVTISDWLKLIWLNNRRLLSDVLICWPFCLCLWFEAFVIEHFYSEIYRELSDVCYILLFSYSYSIAKHFDVSHCIRHKTRISRYQSFATKWSQNRTLTVKLTNF